MVRNYKNYIEDEIISVTKKELYTDYEGFLNEKAFHNFVSTLTKEDDYRLLCLIIDVTQANKKSYATGSLIMRTTVFKLAEYFFVFRVNGNKFNVLLKKRDFESFVEFVKKEKSDLFSMYYGFVGETPVTKESIEDIRKLGVSAMYEDKAEKTKRRNLIREDKIIGNKGNVPVELQETTTRKHIETMWYATIKIQELEPFVKDVMVYVFPTEFKPPLASLNMVVVVDDLINQYVYSGSNIRFGFDGMRFNLTSRFDKAGKLSVSFFKEKSLQGKYQADIYCHEGEYIPVFFGKYIGEEKEIYPFKRNAFGTQDYILWNNKERKAEIIDTGIIKIGDKEYSVYADDTGIDLCKLS